MSSLSDHVDAVFAVDTHRDTHQIAHLDANGGVLTEVEITATMNGYDQALDLATSSNIDRRAWVIEGCGSYGAGLCRVLQAAGETVYEVERPARPKRQNPAKSDRIDAIRAGRESLGRDIDQLAVPRLNDHHDRLSALVSARRGAVDQAADATRQLHAAIVVAPEQIRTRFTAAATTGRKIKLAAALRPDSYHDELDADHARALRSIARRINAAKTEADELTKRLEVVTRQWRPDLLEHNGVGPVVAAVVLCAWAHPDRFRSDAAFKTFAGAAPIDVSTGNTDRQRLNPGGDRQLNRHLHTVVLCRLRNDPETRAYRDKKRAEGKTDREIRRCLKSYIARQLFRQLQNPST
jgi:transposase